MKTAKRALSLLLSLMLVLGAVSVGGINAAADESLYEISSYADLKNFASLVNSGNTSACAKLMNDIECKNDDGTAAKDWTPIGNVSNNYIGTFDGDGHVITGLSNAEVIDAPYYAGLFGYVGSKTEGGVTTKGTVKNVGLVGVNITGKDKTGGVVGYNDGGTVTDCYSTGSVTGGGMYTGGVVGKNEGTVQNCYNTGNVNSTAEDSFVGGIAGSNNGTIQNCHFTGTVSGSRTTGGIAGFNNNGCSIQHCYNAGSVTDDNYAGGLTGDNYGTVRDCYNTGNVTATGDYSYAGGVAGNNVGQLINCYNTGIVTDGFNGGIVGKNLEGTTQNCFYDSAVLTGIPASAWPKNYNGALSTAQMTGANALDNMTFAYEAGEENPWLTKADEVDEDGGYIWFYPHLKGFNLDADSAQLPADEIEAADWPAKAEVSVTGDSCTYDGKAHEVYVTVGDTSVPEGGDVTYSQYTYSDEDNRWEWEDISVTPTGHGNYKMVIRSGNEVIETKYFTILQPDTDYTAFYYKKTGEDWSMDSVDPIDAGDYKAVVTFTDTGHDQIEKEFKITPKAVTVTAASEEFTYDGTAHSNNGYEVRGLVGSDAITAVVTGSITYPSESPVPNVIESYSFTSGNAGNYTVTTVNGELTMSNASKEITITSASGEWTYDGSAHSDNTVTVTGGSLFEGDELVAEATGSATNVSDTAEGNNIIADGYKIMHGDKDVTENYVITAVNGTLTINPAKVTVTITGKHNSAPYDGREHTVSDYNAESSNPLYRCNGETLDFNFTGTAKARRTDAGTTYMGLTDSQFVNKNANFDVTFDVTDGYQTIVPISVDVTVKGNSATADYDGNEKSVTGYTAKASNSLYDVENDIEFSGSAEVKLTEPGTESMGLSASQFTNSNENFNVTFTVEEDGKLTVNPVIKFVNEDGTELQSGAVAYGSTPEYTGSTPEKAASDGNTYEFTGWSPEITAATGNATYTATYKAVPIKIDLGEFESTTGYKEEQTFTVDTSDLPEGAEVHWFVNGEDVGTGESYTVEDPTDDYTVQAKVIDKDGNTIAESEEQKVEVKNGFFDRLKAFFAELIEKILGKAIADFLSSVC